MGSKIIAPWEPFAFHNVVQVYGEAPGSCSSQTPFPTKQTKLL